VTDPQLLQAYISFCTKEHSEENIIFWNDVKQYSRMLANRCSIQEIDTKAKYIFSQYIARDSPFEVHLPVAIRSSIMGELNFLHPDMFAEAAQCAFDMMKEDSGKRFIKSEECQRVLMRKEKEKE